MFYEISKESQSLFEMIKSSIGMSKKYNFFTILKFIKKAGVKDNLFSLQ